jgi:hypothetical protein
MMITNKEFQHHHAAHCESGVASNLMIHHGVALSEAMAFGLSSALSFAYLPFVKLTGFPLIAYRMPPKSILKGMSRPFQASFQFETFRDPAKGMNRLDALLTEGRVVGLQTSVFWLPYFPEDMRFHFNAHNLLISDPVTELPQRCGSADLQRARFAKGALAPKGLLYYPTNIGRTEILPEEIKKAIRKTVRIMLGPIPIVGVRGMRMLANKVAKLDGSEHSLNYVGHIVRMQEEIGTGGGGFRFLYAAFLQESAQITGIEALAALSERLVEIGDGWREFALKAARMIRGREAFDARRLADMLNGQAEQEKEFFQALKRAIA